MKFHEQWFDTDAQAALRFVARGIANTPGLIIEIGSWEGCSTLALADAVAPRVVHAVDTWEGSPSDESSQIAARYDVFAAWSSNLAEHVEAGTVVAHRMGWREYVPTITEPVALCFIDAEHTYDEVYDNIKAILPRVATGGVICGDDYSRAPVAKAANAALGSVWGIGALWAWVKP